MNTLPTEAKERKEIPLVRGVLDYFPAALAAVAQVSFVGNQQHNPGEEMHWARGKSSDHADCIVRHLVDRGTFDKDGVRHSAKVAWRALALLQEELEAAGAPLARGSRPAKPVLEVNGYPYPKPASAGGKIEIETSGYVQEVPPVALGQCEYCREHGHHARWCIRAKAQGRLI